VTKEKGPGVNGAPTTTEQVDTANCSGIAAAVSSQQVNWWEVHEFVAPVLKRAGPLPIVGSPGWCALPDTDPRKVAALFDAAQHWALRVETCQTAECEASQAISAAADWSAVARYIHDETTFYAGHPWLKRKAS
jgi:hypothetical protein